MARMFIEGFEGGNFDLWDYDSGCSLVSASLASMTGDYCCDIGGLLEKDFSDNETTVGVNFDVKFDGTPGLLLFYLYCDAMSCFILRISAESSYIKYTVKDLSDSEVESYEFNTIYPTSKFNVQAVMTNPSPGYYTYQILHNGNEILNGNFSYGSCAFFNKIRFGFETPSSTIYIDNIVIDNEEIPGASEVYGLVPYANGTTSEWSSSDSTNFQSIDDIPRNDNNYIYTDVFDEIDLFKLTDVPVSGREIKSLFLFGYSQQTVGPPPTEHTRLVVRTDSTNFLGATEEIHVAGDFGRTEQILQRSPSSRESWEEAKINDLEIGIKLVG